jgi:hypothetical protein
MKELDTTQSTYILLPNQGAAYLVRRIILEKTIVTQVVNNSFPLVKSEVFKLQVSVYKNP